MEQWNGFRMKKWSSLIGHLYCKKNVLELLSKRISAGAGEEQVIVSQMQKNKDYRKETQPWNFPCAGSIFRNPLPNYAGELIEEAGLKRLQYWWCKNF